MHTTRIKMKYSCVIIVLNCLIDACFFMQINAPSGNAKFFQSPEQLLTANQTNETQNLNTSVFYSDSNKTTIPGYFENTTEIYKPEFRKEAFHNQSGWENKTISVETIAVDPHNNDFGITELAGIACVCFLVLAVFGYFGFVLLRKHLVNKYGNSQTLITEDEYDTSDLRNFTI